MANYLQMIQEKRREFTKSFRKIADNIEEHTVEIAFISVQEMCKRTGLSVATIHRFCQAVGLNGYTDLQREIQKEIRRSYNDESAHVDDAETAQGIFSSQAMRNIRILQEINEDAEATDASLRQAAELMIRARRVYIIGLEGDYGSAFDAYFEFTKLLDECIFLSLNWGDYLPQIRTITSDDLLYVVSFRVHNRNILDVLNQFMKVNAKIVTVTDAGSPFRMFSTVSIVPRHETPSYGSVIKATVQRSLLLTIIKKLKEEHPENNGLSYFEEGGLE